MTWRSGRWLRLVAATALLAAGCGSGNPSATGSVTSALPTSTVTATPTSTKSLALVNLRGVSHIVVRDLSDIDHPTTLAALGMTPPQPQFVSSTEFAYLDPDVIGDFATYPANLMRAPFSGSPKTLMVSAVHGIFLYAFAPDGRTAAYLSTHSFGSELHLVSGGNDRLVSSMPSILGGCEASTCAFLLD